MGLFGPKKSAEEKNFIKALKDAPSMKGKHMPELLAATEAYPCGWQGYWFLGLYHDFAHGKSEQPDPVKAQEYFLKAEAAARGTQDEAWLNNFMAWYRRPAGNLLKPLSDSAKKIRSLAVALLNCYQHKVPVIMAPADAKDDPFGRILSNCSSFEDLYEYEAISDYFTGIDNLWMCKERDDFIKEINPIIKKYNKANDAYDDCKKALEKGKTPNWDKLKDMYAYMLGFNCLNDGPFITGELASSWNMPSEAALGIRFYLFASRSGNQPAIHELVRLANASKGNYDLMSSVFRAWNPYYKGDLELYLLEKLLKCLEQDDDEARRLVDLYYADRMAELADSE